MYSRAFLVQLQLSGGISSDTAAVADTIAINDRKAWLQKGDRSGNIVKHKNLRRLWILDSGQQGSAGAGMAQGDGDGIRRVVRLGHFFKSQ